MARGGARPGAGRKPGTPGKRGPKPITQVRRAIAEQILNDGDLTPLQVMIEAMRDARSNGDMRLAAQFANMAAPYVHPRLATLNANIDGEVRATITVVSEFPDE